MKLKQFFAGAQIAKAKGAGFFAESTGTAGDLYIYDFIDPYWGISADMVMRAMVALPEDTAILRVHLNSPGGSVFEGVAIMNLLKGFDGEVEIYVESLAASIASVILLAGVRRYIAPNAMVMIHEAWTIAAGNKRDFRKEADTMERIEKATIVTSYVDATGLDPDFLMDLMEAETWMSAEEAVKDGFCTAIMDADTVAKIKPAGKAQAYDLKALGFEHVPSTLAVMPDPPAEDPEEAARLRTARERKLKLLEAEIAA